MHLFKLIVVQGRRNTLTNDFPWISFDEWVEGQSVFGHFGQYDLTIDELVFLTHWMEVELVVGWGGVSSVGL